MLLAVFWDGHSKECYAYLYLCSALCTNFFKHYSFESPNRLSVKHGQSLHWPAVEMVIPLEGMPRQEQWREARLLGTPVGSNVAFSPDGQPIVSGSYRRHDSCVECHDGSNGGWPVYWAHQFGPLCCILAGWAADCLWFT